MNLSTMSLATFTCRLLLLAGLLLSFGSVIAQETDLAVDPSVISEVERLMEKAQQQAQDGKYSEAEATCQRDHQKVGGRLWTRDLPGCNSMRVTVWRARCCSGFDAPGFACESGQLADSARTLGRAWT